MNTQKRLKHIDGRGSAPECKEYGANSPFSKKIFQKRKNKIFKNQKIKNSSFRHIRVRACACESKNCVKLTVLCMCDAIKY